MAASIAVVYLLFSLPPFLLAHAIRVLPASVDPWFMVFALQVAFFVVAASLFRPPRAVFSFAADGANAAGVRAVFWLVSGGVLFSIAAAITIVSTADVAAAGFNVENGMRSLTRELPRSGLAGALIQRTVFGPVFEEFVFRALLLGFLLKPLRPWLALLISTALFMSVHSSWPTAAFGGIVYGLLYLRYRNVWLCILAHGANNLLVAAGVPMLIAHLHEIGMLHPVQGNLLPLQVTWAAVVLACFAMFVACLLRKDEGKPVPVPGSG